MGRLPVLPLLIVAVTAGACAGTQIPKHNGYKGGSKAKPWKKAKTLKFDDKMEAKVEGDLSYGEMRRSAWFVADLVQPGHLEPGRYMVHLYLQGRLDTADYVLRAAFKPMNTVGKSDFPAQVSFPQPLPMVPLQDDTPKNYKPATPTTVVTVKKQQPKKVTPPPPPAVTTMNARIIGMQVVGASTQITIGRGTTAGAIVGMKGKIVGVPTGSFTLAACNERTCTATVSATPDQIKSSGSVVLTP
jgi:hypothetical protein